jgi:uncharacterized protein (DUF2236 family)
MIDALAEPLRVALLGQVQRLTAGGRRVDFTQPAGAPGWFDADSVCWRVHADFVPMLVGGIRALLLQALHPLALAAVWDHSNLHGDLSGRLGRTALFIAATTYGDAAMAAQAVLRVRAIHAQVHGTALDGRAYAADDPALLTWVHVAEVSSFLDAWMLLGGGSLSVQEQNDYYAETARVAQALGATQVPVTRAAALDYLQGMRAQLAGGERAQAILALLRGLGRGGLRHWLNRPYIDAGCALLPPWARQLYGLPALDRRRDVVLLAALRPSVSLLRWALRDGVAAQARQRLSTAPATTTGAKSGT